jgi:hypothetical protein
LKVFKGVVQQDYQTSIVVNASCEQALAAIADVSGWWAKNFTGKADAAGDLFRVTFGDTFVDFAIAHPTPHEITWIVTNSYLPWQEDKTEWNGTRVIWQVNETESGSHIDMRHIGLSPRVACYQQCNEGWNEHIKQSLFNFINTGEGELQ